MRGVGVHHPQAQGRGGGRREVVAGQQQAARARHDPAVGERDGHGAEGVGVPGGRALRQRHVRGAPPGRGAVQPPEQLDQLAGAEPAYPQGGEGGGRGAARLPGRQQVGQHVGEDSHQVVAARIEHHGPVGPQ